MDHFLKWFFFLWDQNFSWINYDDFVTDAFDVCLKNVLLQLLQQHPQLPQQPQLQLPQQQLPQQRQLPPQHKQVEINHIIIENLNQIPNCECGNGYSQSDCSGMW